MERGKKRKISNRETGVRGLDCDCQGGSLGELAGKSMGINNGEKKLVLTM